MGKAGAKIERAEKPLRTEEQKRLADEAFARIAENKAKAARAREMDAARRQKAANDDFLAELIRRVPHNKRVRITSHYPAHAANDGVMADLERHVQEIVREAVSVIARMPSPAASFPAGAKAAWPEVVLPYFEAGDHKTNTLPRDIPLADEVDRAMKVIALLYQLTQRERKIVSARAMGFSNAVLGKQFGCSKDTIRKEHRMSLLTLAILLISHDLILDCKLS